MFYCDLNAPYSSGLAGVNGSVPMMPMGPMMPMDPMVPNYGLNMQPGLVRDTFVKNESTDKSKTGKILFGVFVAAAAVTTIILGRGKGTGKVIKGAKHLADATARATNVTTNAAKVPFKTKLKALFAKQSGKTKPAATPTPTPTPTPPANQMPKYTPEDLIRWPNRKAAAANLKLKPAPAKPKLLEYKPTTPPAIVAPAAAPIGRGNANTAAPAKVIELGAPIRKSRHEVLLDRTDFWHNKFLKETNPALKTHYETMYNNTWNKVAN